MFQKRFSAGLFALFASGFFLISCSSSQKTASKAIQKECNYARAGGVVMNLETSRSTQISGNNLPKNYTVFIASNEKDFFQTAKKEGGMAALELPSGCRQFRLSLSGTMTPQMMERYPDLVSLKGNSENGADLRIDWDGTAMRGQIIENGKSYVLEPHASSGKHVYLFFSKDDVTVPSRPFEKSNHSELKKQQPAVDR